jgi:hypothetical protein
MKAWTERHLHWIRREVKFEQFPAEVGQLSRFTKARQLMGYSGTVARENSIGECTRRGAISRTGPPPVSSTCAVTTGHLLGASRTVRCTLSASLLVELQSGLPRSPVGRNKRCYHSIDLVHYMIYY